MIRDSIIVFYLLSVLNVFASAQIIPLSFEQKGFKQAFYGDIEKMNIQSNMEISILSSLNFSLGDIPFYYVLMKGESSTNKTAGYLFNGGKDAVYWMIGEVKLINCVYRMYAWYDKNYQLTDSEIPKCACILLIRKHDNFLTLFFDKGLKPSLLYGTSCFVTKYRNNTYTTYFLDRKKIRNCAIYNNLKIYQLEREMKKESKCIINNKKYNYSEIKKIPLLYDMINHATWQEYN